MFNNTQWQIQWSTVIFKSVFVYGILGIHIVDIVGYNFFFLNINKTINSYSSFCSNKTAKKRPKITTKKKTILKRQHTLSEKL